MSNASKYRKKAVEYEQLKQFDRAVASYVRAIEENENASEEVDVALFNKVGDLTLRQGRVTEAVTYYERAVEHYVSNGLYDNAIALCNKILRNAPGRSNVYFTLGRICGRKGLRTDATRNFLEYATRMQQEGRVDEGMRALAEVADLMPELTEVRRLVEEHAARAGISLAPRRRNTPARAAAQSDAEPVRSFGLSKDLVFLQIDYDAVKAAREKTPPPQRSIVADAPVAPSPARSAPAPAAASSKLEDLMIFDPNADGGVIEDDAPDATIVDGASILKPYADTTAPVASLDDLESTEFKGTPAYNEAIASATTISDLLQRGVTPRAPGSEANEEPFVIAKVPTIPNFPAVLHVEDVAPLEDVASEHVEQFFVDAEVATPASTNEVLVAPVVAEFVEIDNEEGRETIADSIVEPVTEQAVAVIDALRVDEVIESPAASLVEENYEIVNFAVEQELNLSLPAEPLDGFTADEEPPVAADITAADDIGVVAAEDVSNVVHTVEADVLPSIDFDAMLESAHADVTLVADLQAEEFATANDDLAAAHFARIEDEVSAELVDEFESEAELPPLIFPMPSNIVHHDNVMTDGMSDDSIVLDDIVVEETIENELLVNDIVIDDAVGHEGVVNELVDHEFVVNELIELDVAEPNFSIGELPEFLVPVELSNTGEFTAADYAAEVADLEFEELIVEKVTTDIVFLDIPDEVVPGLAAIDFDILEAPIVADGIEFDLLEDTIQEFDTTLLDISSEHASVDAASRNDAAFELLTEATEPSAPDDLDDLFGDTDVPTAVVAAEATLVASSRCSELRTASEADPENFVLRRRLAEALFEAGNREEAIAEFGAALAIAELANALSDAADIADELVHVAGDEIAHHQKRLELAIRLGDQSRLRDAYLDLADNLVRRGEDLRAKAVYARVLEIDPWDDRARTALGDSAPPAPAKPPVAGSDDGHVSLADWLRDDDEPASTRLRMREPDISGDEQDDFNALLKHFKEGVARSLGEDDYESHYDLGVAYKEMGLLDDAIGEFQMALRSRSNRLAAYEALGQCFIEQQSYKVAVTVLSRALHEPAIQDEQRVGVLYLLGISCEVLQRFDEARSYFQRVYATDIHFRDVGQRLADLERSVR